MKNFFFKGYYSKGNAIIDIALLEEWIEENFEIMSDEDESDRRTAYKELEKGESPDLKEAMKKMVKEYNLMAAWTFNQLAKLRYYRPELVDHAITEILKKEKNCCG